MAEMLLINPRRRTRRKAKRAAPARRRRNPLALARVMPRRRRRNPIAAVRRRRANPIGAMRRRVMRRRNPAMLGGYMGAIREALMDGFGAVAIESQSLHYQGSH